MAEGVQRGEQAGLLMPLGWGDRKQPGGGVGEGAGGNSACPQESACSIMALLFLN